MRTLLVIVMLMKVTNTITVLPSLAVSLHTIRFVIAIDRRVIRCMIAKHVQNLHNDKKCPSKISIM